MASSTADTRVFSTTRLRSFHGYSDVPVLDPWFEWKLPKGIRYYGREILSEGHRYEAWSCNSLRDAFYPGLRHESVALVKQPVMKQCRYDGHLGRFDPTINPQPYDAQRPWLGFIPAPFLHGDDEEVTSRFVCQVWQSEPDTGYLGRLDPQFVKDLNQANTTANATMELLVAIRQDRPDVWANRPRAPWPSDFDGLVSETRYEVAVDRVRELQRGILEKDGWSRMAIAWRDYGVSIEKMRTYPIVPANDKLIGVWIHGITELDMLFFLTCGAVPCYLIHELCAEEPMGELVVKSFTETTVIHRYLEPYNYEYDRVAFSLNNGQYTGIETRPPLVIAPYRDLEKRVRSGGRWQLGLTSDDRVPSSKELILLLSKEEEARTRPSRKRRDSDSVSLDINSEDERVLGMNLVTPPMSFPGLDATTLTHVLKFELSESFSPDDMKNWLDAVRRKVPGCDWKVVYLVVRRPRHDYIVEFSGPEAALKVRGLLDSRSGEVRDSIWMGATEYAEVQKRLKAVKVADETEVVTPVEPYAGGRYLRDEPPTTTHLPPAAPVPEREGPARTKPVQGPNAKAGPSSSKPSGGARPNPPAAPPARNRGGWGPNRGRPPSNDRKWYARGQYTPSRPNYQPPSDYRPRSLLEDDRGILPPETDRVLGAITFSTPLQVALSPPILFAFTEAAFYVAWREEFASFAVSIALALTLASPWFALASPWFPSRSQSRHGSRSRGKRRRSSTPSSRGASRPTSATPPPDSVATTPSLLDRLAEGGGSGSLFGRLGVDLQSRLSDTAAPNSLGPARTHRRVRKRPKKKK
ncbi:hypothetical protein C8R47DRAFT_1217923 [Mycena vitilis]|nr:hypothetical protein C8R47DRAFT_1217923 [Mycena vitilis]